MKQFPNYAAWAAWTSALIAALVRLNLPSRLLTPNTIHGLAAETLARFIFQRIPSACMAQRISIEMTGDFSEEEPKSEFEEILEHNGFKVIFREESALIYWSHHRESATSGNSDFLGQMSLGQLAYCLTSTFSAKPTIRASRTRGRSVKREACRSAVFNNINSAVISGQTSEPIEFVPELYDYLPVIEKDLKLNDFRFEKIDGRFKGFLVHIRPPDPNLPAQSPSGSARQALH